PPVPHRVQMTGVLPGQTTMADGGGFPKAQSQCTVWIVGDPDGVFSVDSLETLHLMHDPDAPRGSRSWETLDREFRARDQATGRCDMRPPHVHKRQNVQPGTRDPRMGLCLFNERWPGSPSTPRWLARYARVPSVGGASSDVHHGTRPCI